MFIQFPKTQHETQCRVNETNVMKLTNGKFQTIWTVNFNNEQSAKVSKIFVNTYKTYTDAIEATINQYKIGEVYKCYFDINKPYDLIWTLDVQLIQGRRILNIAFVLGILILIIWAIPIGYFFHKWFKNKIINSTKIEFSLKNTSKDFSQIQIN